LRPEEEVLRILKEAELEVIATLPCEKVKRLLEGVPEGFIQVPLTREEEGVGICAGAYLSGLRPGMLIQSAGVGNMVNALCSLTKYYRFPLPILVSWRGVYKEKVAAHKVLGKALPRLLAALDIPWREIQTRRDIPLIKDVVEGAFLQEKPFFGLLSPKLWSGGGEDLCPERDLKERRYEARALSPRLTRFEVLQAVSPYLEGKPVVCNLGFPCRELYAVLDQESNFYMLGSMGMCSPIALGVALGTDKEVVAVEGDGSLLMNPGTMATIAMLNPSNLTIIAIDNGAYGSTGNQPTLTARGADLEMVARGFGMEETIKVSEEEDIMKALRNRKSGSRFIHVLAKPGNADVPHLPLSEEEIKSRFMEFLRR
jgi:sulfopyruvate decarboxylase subunit beta